MDIGLTFISEIITEPGVEVVGPLPRDISTPTALVGYVSAHTREPDAAEALLMRVWTPALAQVGEEAATLRPLAARDGVEFAAWDWRYYAEEVRRTRYALDGAAVKTHLTLERVRTAAFTTAERLYGLRFAEREDLPVWHDDVRTWAVTNTDGSAVGLFGFLGCTAGTDNERCVRR